MIIDGGFLLLGSFRGKFGRDNPSVCSKSSVLPDTCPQDSMNGDTGFLHDLDWDIMSQRLDKRHDPFGYSQQHAHYLIIMHHYIDFSI